MPQTIQLKNSTVSADTLTTLLKGEPAVNLADKQVIVGDGTTNHTLVDANRFNPVDGTIMADVFAVGKERHPTNGLGGLPKVIMNGYYANVTPYSSYDIGSVSIGESSAAFSVSSTAIGASNYIAGSDTFTYSTDTSTCVGASNNVLNGPNNYLFGFTQTADTLAGQVIMFGSGNTCYADYGIIFGYGNTLNAGATTNGTIIVGQGIATDYDGFLVMGSYNATMWLDMNNNAGIGQADPTVITQKLQVDGGVRLETDSSRPTADSDSRGTMWVVKGGSGVADTLQVCLKSAAGTYSWKTIATG